MEFRTPIIIPRSAHQMGLQTPVLALGSCFAEVMGKRLLENKFKALVNPFGVIFNPVSLARLLQAALGGQPVNEEGLVQTPEGWRHYDFHSRLGAAEPNTVLMQVTQALTETSKFLETARWLLLTLGTAFVYRRKDNGLVVANCHKAPNSYFSKEMLSLEEIVASLGDVFAQLAQRCPQLRIILTVSPVRHTKDTLPLNGVSKSLLRVACHELTERHEQAAYFPAYEIMLDDLRDYRFYKPDMIHPSEVAEAYIWQKLGETYFDASTTAFVQEWSKIRQDLRHRPFNVHAEAHQNFVKGTLSRLEALRDTIAVEEEIALLSSQLKDSPRKAQC